jgi:hypothetical protein
MAENWIPVWIWQLAAQAPVLLVYAVGIVLALAFWSRCPGPCRLTLIGSILLLVTAVLQSCLFSFLVFSDQESGWVLGASGLVWGILRACGFSLLLAAVFLGRRPTVRPAPVRTLPQVEPAPPSGHEEGITRRPET